MKIIWNITDKCPYNCKICATYDTNKKELNFEEKIIALNSILSIQNYVTEIDFSGGDPLYDLNSKKIIKRAIDIWDCNSVCVTTTGYSIELLSEEEKKSLLKNIELTLDLKLMGSSFRNHDYGVSNLNALYRNLDYIKRITVNTPLIEISDLPNIDSFIKTINNLPLQNVTIALLRLMPVGKAHSMQSIENYEYLKIINYVKESLNKNVKLHLHCAFRGCLDLENRYYCNMLEDKIGVDCAGNVYTCPWCGYINKCNIKNPFYIGNLLNKSLRDILQEAKDLYNFDTFQSRSCRLFSYYYGNENIYAEADPLLIKGYII